MTAEFYADLLATGSVRITSAEPPTAFDRAEAARILLDSECARRGNLVGAPPEIDVAAVEWAADRLYRAAQFLVFRELGESELRRQLSVPGPEPTTACNCYSVDLAFQFLPGLVRLARTAAENDPLLDVLLEWSRRWPLSSVGTPRVPGNLEPKPLDAVLADETLRMIYVDRIFSSEDGERLTDDRVREAVRAALGAYPKLSPKIAEAIRRMSSPGPESASATKG